VSTKVDTYQLPDAPPPPLRPPPPDQLLELLEDELDDEVPEELR